MTINVPKKKKEKKHSFLDVGAHLYIRVNRRYRRRSNIYRYISGPCTRSMPWTVCDATTNYTWARGRSRWLGPQEAGSTPLKLELRRPSARKTTRRQYEPPPTPWSRGRGGETRLARGEVAREGERGARKPPLSFTFYFVSRFYFDRLNLAGSIARWSIIIPVKLQFEYTRSSNFAGVVWQKY